MKVIEKIIPYEDYNYVEGFLQFKAYGKKSAATVHSELFDIKSIAGVELQVAHKYLAPEIPPSINKNKVSTLSLPDEILTIVANDFSKPYRLKYDEIIIDDAYVDANGNISGKRFNSTKAGNELSSTIRVKAYGLIKIPKERIEYENLYEIHTESYGSGKIALIPQQDFYKAGDLILVKASPDASQDFLGWGAAYQNCPQEFELEVLQDHFIEANFTDLEEEFDVGTSKWIGDTVYKDGVNGPRSLKGIYDELYKSSSQSFDKAKYRWENTRIKSDRFNYEATGCWDILGGIFTAGIGIFILIFMIAVMGQWFFIFALSIFGIWLLTILPRFINRFIVVVFNLFKWLFGIAVGLFLIVGVLKFIENISYYQDHKTESNRIPPPVVEEATEFTEQLYTHRLQWNDYLNNSYTATLSIAGTDVNAASKLRNSINGISSSRDYNQMLAILNRGASLNSYNLLIPELRKLRDSRNLDKVAYANMIVSMVQSIPYYVIIENTCNPFSYQDPFLRDLLATSPCEPNVKHGINAPAEFLMNLKGDCDTRTLFLYGLLKQEGYDVVIFGSEKYKHSILGIDLPILSPNYKWVNGTKYYLWETTNTGFEAGYIPATISNTSYWNLNLN
ncbi:hypothetical protein [Leeuwenhoekiella marinoflava]|uniref:Transglutaminase superfamily protein n=2 Tax=Leeuwenhoekiella marinoflava TaxID=988 RepID=A0A4Q0PLM9_9FLAO|nr:hypothetical protein [Leeuwenhoekiella marinoflava]RXG29873.1 hypothetical protein DSL99_1926 [Leeuwenhoekiella marinoflava]SHF27663.1 hypothetical protein SAMN02745246_02111 [Leeuwenhoekiella marinoflava DSM 3653]